MEKINKNKIAFTFATSEVSKIGQSFIKFIELCTGKLKLKKLYDQYLEEQNRPENFWHDAVKKLELQLIPNFHNNCKIPKKGRLIVVANHAFGVADGVSICSIISKIRQDYKIITHKVLSQAEAAKDKIIAIDFSQTKDSVLANIKARKEAEKYLNADGVIIMFPSGQIATKENLKLKTKAHDGQWKQFVSKLIVKTKSPVLPMFVEGENSYLYHVANKMGQTFRYSLLMYELTRKIGDIIKLHIGTIIPFAELEKLGDLKDITGFVREKTYSLDPELTPNL